MGTGDVRAVPTRLRPAAGAVAVVALIGWTLVEALVLALLRVFDRRRVVTV